MTQKRTWPSPARTRRYPKDFGANLLHFIGDTHTGPCPQWRLDLISSEYRRGVLPPPLAHIQVGDNTDNGFAAENTKFRNFMTRLPASWYNVPGNHDLLNQTAAQWCSEWSRASQCYIVDFSSFRIIFLGGDSSSSQLSAASLSFLDTALAGTSKPCFVVYHFPLYNSVGGNPSFEYTSTTANFYANTASRPADSQDILDVLAAHSNMKLWVSGHTHSRLSVPGIVMPFAAGSQRFASVNTSAVWYQGLDHNTQVGGVLDQVPTCFVSWYDSGMVEVRFRDHNAGEWVPCGPTSQLVQRVAGL